MNNKIFLIGMMGAGKTSVGVELSTLIKKPFIDIDDVINASSYITQNSIEDFRKLEDQTILKISKDKKKLIISLGGGSILNQANRYIIKQNYCIYLESSIEILISRIMNQDSFRPLIQSKKNGEINIDIFKNLFKERESLYNNLSDFKINTNNKCISEITDDIRSQLISDEIIN